MSPRTWLRSWLAATAYLSPRTPTPRTRLGVHRLEDRDVPAADFLSALTAGTDTGGNVAEDVVVDAAGYSYLTGMFTGTLDFDPADPPDAADTLTARGTKDAFVAKYAPDNSLAWVRRMGGEADRVLNDYGRGVAVDPDGNVYVAGTFAGSADFGHLTRTADPAGDGFVAKLARDGTFLWASRWGREDRMEQGYDVAVDPAGNVLAVGYSSYVNPDGSVGEAYQIDAVKFGPAGGQVWGRAVSSSLGAGYGVATDAAGNVYMAGRFAGTVDFDPGPRTMYATGGPEGSGFVLKLTAAGAFGWVAPLAGQPYTDPATGGSKTGSGYCRDLALDGAGNVVAGGLFSGPLDFDPGKGKLVLPSTAAYDSFVVKLTPQGSLGWAKSLGGSSLKALAVDGAGAVYAAGSFRETVDFDPGAGTYLMTSGGMDDGFVVRLDAGGGFGWAAALTGEQNQQGWGIAVDGAGAVYVAGGTWGVVDFDPDPVAAYAVENAAYADLFLVKLRQD